MSYNDSQNAATERRENDGSAAPDDQIQREIQEAKNYLELQELRKRVEEERKKEEDARQWEKAKTEWKLIFIALFAYLFYRFCKASR
ncbi:MAG: hypothetical protein IJN32_03115 [Thermoguttaceae bacterium]|nr:hypothetical protein [Thermoguttaceae bacterium]